MYNKNALHCFPPMCLGGTVRACNLASFSSVPSHSFRYSWLTRSGGNVACGSVDIGEPHPRALFIPWCAEAECQERIFSHTATPRSGISPPLPLSPSLFTHIFLLFAYSSISNARVTSPPSASFFIFLSFRCSSSPFRSMVNQAKGIAVTCIGNEKK